jgi:hypothetical protein
MIEVTNSSSPSNAHVICNVRRVELETRHFGKSRYLPEDDHQHFLDFIFFPQALSILATAARTPESLKEHAELI